MADCDTQKVEIFELIDNKYKQTDTTQFNVTATYSISLDANSLLA